MNGSDRKKRYYTTPRGEALFARLVDPDYGTERYPDPRGSFHVTLALGAEEARRLDALLKPALEEAREFASRKAGQNRDKTGGPELSFAAPGIPERDREGSFTDRRLYRFRTNAFYQQPGGWCRCSMPRLSAWSFSGSPETGPWRASRFPWPRILSRPRASRA